MPFQNDLAMILNFLNQPLFDPLSEAEPMFLTWKMIFLVTMALAAGSSEVHTLSFAELGFEDNYKFAVLSTVPEFQPKLTGDKLS